MGRIKKNAVTILNAFMIRFFGDKIKNSSGNYFHELFLDKRFQSLINYCQPVGIDGAVQTKMCGAAGFASHQNFVSLVSVLERDSASS